MVVLLRKKNYKRTKQKRAGYKKSFKFWRCHEIFEANAKKRHCCIKSKAVFQDSNSYFGHVHTAKRNFCGIDNIDMLFLVIAPCFFLTLILMH